MANSMEDFRGFSQITLRNKGVFPEPKSQSNHYSFQIYYPLVNYPFHKVTRDIGRAMQ